MNPNDWENFDPNDQFYELSSPAAQNPNQNLYQYDGQPAFSNQPSPYQDQPPAQNQYPDPDPNYQPPDPDGEYAANLLNDYNQVQGGRSGVRVGDFGQPVSHSHGYGFNPNPDLQQDVEGQSVIDPDLSALSQQAQQQQQQKQTPQDGEGDSQMSGTDIVDDDSNESIFGIDDEGNEIGDLSMTAKRPPTTRTVAVTAPRGAPEGVLTMPEAPAPRALPGQSQPLAGRGRGGGLTMPEPGWTPPAAPFQPGPGARSTHPPFLSQGPNLAPFGGQADGLNSQGYMQGPLRGQLPVPQFEGTPMGMGTGQNFGATQPGSMLDTSRPQSRQRPAQYGGMGAGQGFGRTQPGFMGGFIWRPQLPANLMPGEFGGYRIPIQAPVPQYDQFGNQFGMQGQPSSQGYPGAFTSASSFAPAPQYPPQFGTQGPAPVAGPNNAPPAPPSAGPRARGGRRPLGDPRLLIDDGPQRQNETEAAFRARIEGVNAALGLGRLMKPYPPAPLPKRARGTNTPGSKADRVESDKRLKERRKAEHDYMMQRDPQDNKYDPAVEAEARASARTRRIGRARIELGLLEILREDQERQGLLREPTPDPGEDSGDAKYNYDLSRDYSTTNVNCNYCSQRQKPCSLKQDPRPPCELCIEKRKKCKRIASWTRRIRGIPRRADPDDRESRLYHRGGRSAAAGQRSASSESDDRGRDFGQEGDEDEAEESWGEGVMWNRRDARRPVPAGLPAPNEHQQQYMQEQQNERLLGNIYQEVRRTQPIDRDFLQNLRERLENLPQTTGKRAPLKQARVKPARAARRAQPPSVNNGFAGNEEMSMRLQQEMQNAQATHGINDRMDQPQQQQSLIPPYNAANAQNVSPLGTAAGNLNPPAHAILAPPNNVPPSTIQNAQNPIQAQGGEPVRLDYQAESGLPNYAWNVILPEIRLLWEDVEQDGEDDCKEDFNWVNKKQNIGNARDLPYQMCMEPGKNCDTQSHGESPYAICESCRNWQDFLAIDWQQQTKDVTRAWLCKGCVAKIRGLPNKFAVQGDTCGCLGVLKKIWLCHRDRERGYTNVKSLAAGINEIVLRNWGEKMCVFCYRNPEDASSGIYTCKVCRVYVEGV